MAILNVNLTKRSDSKGTMVPDGKYTVEVAKAFLGKSKVKRVDQIEVHLEVVSPEEWVGSTIMEFLPLSEASEWKRADFFHACGFDSDENEPVAIDTDEIARWDENGEVLNEQGALLDITKKTVKDSEGKSRIRLWFARPQQVAAPVLDDKKVAKRRIVR